MNKNTLALVIVSPILVLAIASKALGWLPSYQVNAPYETTIGKIDAGSILIDWNDADNNAAAQQYRFDRMAHGDWSYLSDQLISEFIEYYYQTELWVSANISPIFGRETEVIWPGTPEEYFLGYRDDGEGIVQGRDHEMEIMATENHEKFVQYDSIPPTALLLGTGLIGIIRFRRRIQKK